MVINDFAKNVSIKKFIDIHAFDKWKNNNPQYLIYSIETLQGSYCKFELLVFYKVINPVQ